MWRPVIRQGITSGEGGAVAEGDQSWDEDVALQRRRLEEAAAGLDPMHAVVGRFIMAAAEMERWLYVAAGTLDRQFTYVKAEAEGPGGIIEIVGQNLALLNTSDRAIMASHLGRALEIVDLRHALVHGVLLDDPRSGLWQSQRPKRLKGEEKRLRGTTEHPWIKRTFDHDELLDMAAEAEALCGFVQTRCVTWAEYLDPDATDV